MKKIIIIGAGFAGKHIVEDIVNNHLDYEIFCILDQDPLKLGKEYKGIKIIDTPNNLSNYLKKENKIEMVIIGTTIMQKEELEKITKLCVKKSVEVKTLPTFSELITSKPFIEQIKEVDITELLGREVIVYNNENLYNYLIKKDVLITGAAGSIGSEIVRQIIKFNINKLILIDLNENDLYFLELFIKQNYSNIKYEIEIANIREKDKMEYLFKKYKPQIVFHAAAHKHVPLMEKNPEEAIKNNVFGTKNLIELADKYKSERFILISTDKAVNPTNVMGATKRLAEMLICEKNKQSETKFMAVRFGNVLGSNGSVIPIFKNLIKERKNLTITHKEITRYFMTIPEASQLVIQAGSLGVGGEVFVLDMGKPVKIIDLAKKMIQLSGLKLDKDIAIDIIGLRPGEKLYEELLYDVKKCYKTEAEKIFIAKLENNIPNLKLRLEELNQISSFNNRKDIVKKLKEIVVTYKNPQEL